MTPRSAGSQGELVHAVSREGRMRVAVDKARNRTQATAVQLEDVAVERLEFAHRADRDDQAVFAEHVRPLDERDLAQSTMAQWRFAPGGRDDLGQIANQQLRHGAQALLGGSRLGRSNPCSRAASSASA